jgi:hypothetical protein
MLASSKGVAVSGENDPVFWNIRFWHEEEFACEDHTEPQLDTALAHWHGVDYETQIAARDLQEALRWSCRLPRDEGHAIKPVAASKFEMLLRLIFAIA